MTRDSSVAIGASNQEAVPATLHNTHTHLYYNYTIIILHITSTHTAWHRYIMNCNTSSLGYTKSVGYLGSFVTSASFFSIGIP